MIITIIILSGCGKEKNKVIENGDTQDLTETEATEMFKEMYGMDNLESQKVYFLEDTLYIDFYFTKEATNSETDSARSYALNTFVLEKSSPYGEIAYMSLVDPRHKDLEWNNTVCNVYKNNKQIWEEKYKGMKLENYKKF